LRGLCRLLPLPWANTTRARGHGQREVAGETHVLGLDVDATRDGTPGFGGQRVQATHHGVIVDRFEVLVERADRAKRRGLVQADHLVAVRAQAFDGIGRADRHRADEVRRVAPAHRIQRDHHRRAGGEAVVDHDHGAAVHVGWRDGQTPVGAPLGQRLALARDGFPQPVGIGADLGGILGDPRVAGLVDRADREFRLAGRAELAHHHHVEVGVEAASDLARHRHRAARDAQHQRAPAAQVRQRGGEVMGCIEAIGKKQARHGNRPDSAVQASGTVCAPPGPRH
jgi:hypothetical protein